MQYEWDSNKERVNIRKHHISFAIAAKALEEGRIILEYYDAEHSAKSGEDRYIAVVDVNRYLLIVYTLRKYETVTRIISARKLTEREVNDYVDKI